MSKDHPVSENNPKGAGRPYHEIDWKLVEQGLNAGSTGTRIASYLGIHHDTLYHAVERKYGMNFTEYSAQKRQKGELMLEIKQFQLALSGDRGMLIWQGKQRLGQKENHDVKFSGDALITKVVTFGDQNHPTPYRSDKPLD